MIIPEHRLNAADQIHHVNEDDFRLSYRDLALVYSVSATCEPHFGVCWNDSLISV